LCPRMTLADMPFPQLVEKVDKVVSESDDDDLHALIGGIMDEAMGTPDESQDVPADRARQVPTADDSFKPIGGQAPQVQAVPSLSIPPVVAQQPMAAPLLVGVQPKTVPQLVEILISAGDTVRTASDKEFDVSVGLKLAKTSKFKADGRRDHRRSAEKVETVWRQLAALSDNPDRRCPTFQGGACSKYVAMAEDIHKRGLTDVELPAWCRGGRETSAAPVQPTGQEASASLALYTTDSSSRGSPAPVSSDGESASRGSPDPVSSDGENVRSFTPVAGGADENSGERLLQRAHNMLADVNQYDERYKLALQQKARSLLRELEEFKELHESAEAAKRQRTSYRSLSGQPIDAHILNSPPHAEADDCPSMFRSLGLSPNVNVHDPAEEALPSQYRSLSAASEELPRQYRSLSSLALTDSLSHYTEAVSKQPPSPSLDDQLQHVIGRLYRALEIAP